MYSFLNDYSEGAHPQVLEALVNTNMVQTVGYGEDEHCQKAKDVIKERIGNKNADVHFLVGGTQTNMLMISYALKHYQAVIACDLDPVDRSLRSFHNTHLQVNGVVLNVDFHRIQMIEHVTIVIIQVSDGILIRGKTFIQQLLIVNITLLHPQPIVEFL